MGMENVELVRELWMEYWESLGLSAEFQGFRAEVASLPGVYVRLLVVYLEGEPAGTVALRPLSENACEVKRLYVRPAFRGRGLARQLLEDIMTEARALGYTEIFCDTLPSMTSALVLYKNMGFTETSAYSDKPTPGAIFLTKKII
jgi:putative acetyltransferase